MVAIMIGAALTASIVIAILIAAFSTRSRDLLATWAERNTLSLVEARPSLLGGPFWYRRSQPIYYVTVRNQAGRVSRAWIRCSRHGVSCRTRDVIWDVY